MNLNEGQPLINDREYIPPRPRLSSDSGHSNQSSARSNGMGFEMNFGDMRRNISMQEVRKVWCDFIVDATFLSIILVSLQCS